MTKTQRPDSNDAHATAVLQQIKDDTDFWTESAIKRLDHVHDVLETIARHSGDQATIDATKHAREMIEETQVDIRELEEAFDDV